MKNIRTATVIIVAVLFFSCSNTRLLSSWKTPDAPTKKYNKVLVVAMMGSKYDILRQNIENEMTDKLKQQGVDAVSSYQQYGPKNFQGMGENDAVKKVSGDGFDAVMVIALLDKDKERSFNPAYLSYTPYGVGGWYRNYHVIYDRIYTPGYYSVSTNYTLEANLYDASDNKLTYSAQTKSYDPNSSQDLSNGFSKTIVDDMVKKDVVMK